MRLQEEIASYFKYTSKILGSILVLMCDYIIKVPVVGVSGTGGYSSLGGTPPLGVFINAVSTSII